MVGRTPRSAGDPPVAHPALDHGQSDGSCHQQMRVVGHDRKGMQTVMSEGVGIIVDGFYDHAGHARLAKVERTAGGLVQQSVQRSKGLPGVECGRREGSIRGQTAIGPTRGSAADGGVRPTGRRSRKPTRGVRPTQHPKLHHFYVAHPIGCAA
jgi:hypothetical protein